MSDVLLRYKEPGEYIMLNDHRPVLFTCYGLYGNGKVLD